MCRHHYAAKGYRSDGDRTKTASFRNYRLQRVGVKANVGAVREARACGYLAPEAVVALAAPFAASVMRSATFCGSCSMATWPVGTEMATPRAFFAPASSIARLNV